MNILIIGGTKFLGRHIAEAALKRNHQLTLFHRGKTNPDLFPEIEHVHGDREKDLALLREKKFDAVVDTCGYFPRVVSISAEALKQNVGRYLFISTISVYKDPVSPDENSPVGTIEDSTMEEITGESYGPLKALCEQVVRDAYSERATIVRPGLIVGPNDPSDRFTYWPVRMERGGDVLAPDRKNQPVQIIDVRDLAEWCVSAIEKNVTGTYNATGPAQPYSLGDFLIAIQKSINSSARLVWTNTEILKENEVEPWSDLPCVVPYDGSGDGFMNANVTAATTHGLTFRSLDRTAKDTLSWWHDAGGPELKSGLAAEKEAKVLSQALSPS